MSPRSPAEKAPRSTLLARARVALARVDRDGVVREATPTLGAMLEWSDRELLGAPLARHVHEDDVALDRGPLLALEAGQCRRFELERRYRRRGGGTFVAREVVSALDGAERCVLLEDVTGCRCTPGGGARGRAVLGEAMSAMAHELRNALAGIGSAVEVIGQGFLADSEERRATHEVRRRVLDLDAIAHELVGFARPRPLRPASCSAHPLLGAVRSELEASSRPLGLEVCGPDAALYADAELLVGALVHLCERAGRASPRASARVRLRPSPDAVELTIEPDGGCAASVGGGVGLAVARRVVEAHGGRLSETSPPGAVTLTLPRGGLAGASRSG